MSATASENDITADPRALSRALSRYRTPRTQRALIELAITLVPFAALWALIWASVTHGAAALGVVLMVPAAGFLVRLFLIMHDCGHGSFFPSKRANEWVGRALGVLTLTPYDLWRYKHGIHHRRSGNLDKPSIGGIRTLTVRGYQALPPRQRLGYRLYRHPLTLLGIAPAYIFLIENRFPRQFAREGRMPWLSTMGTNAGIIAVAGLMMALVGPVTFLAIQLPILLIAATIGVWLFYVQHQFENTLWEREGDRTFHRAALYGSSYYELPPVLQWFTANIGIHHVHHLASGIPYYRLPEVLRDYPELREIGRLTLRQSLGVVWLALWDEDERRLISFAEAEQRKLVPQT